MSRQEEAYSSVMNTFTRLVYNDPKIHNKEDILAFWHDFFENPGVKNNMVQAFSNFLWEIDQRIDAAKLAGMEQIREAFDLAVPGDASHPENLAVSKLVNAIIDEQIALEKTPETELEESEIESTDLTEVGGGDEDDTPLI